MAFCSGLGEIPNQRVRVFPGYLCADTELTRQMLMECLLDITPRSGTRDLSGNKTDGSFCSSGSSIQCQEKSKILVANIL